MSDNIYIVTEISGGHKLIFDKLSDAQNHVVSKGACGILSVGPMYLEKYLKDTDKSLYTDKRRHIKPGDKEKQEGVKQLADHKRKRRITRNHERT